MTLCKAQARPERSYMPAWLSRAQLTPQTVPAVAVSSGDGGVGLWSASTH